MTSVLQTPVCLYRTQGAVDPAGAVGEAAASDVEYELLIVAESAMMVRCLMLDRCLCWPGRSQTSGGGDIAGRSPAGWSVNSTPPQLAAARRGGGGVAQAAARPCSTCCRRSTIARQPKSGSDWAASGRNCSRQAADAAAESSTITLHADAMPLSKILAAFQAAIGQHDRRLPPAIRPAGDRSPVESRLRQDAVLAGLGSGAGPGRADALSLCRAGGPRRRGRAAGPAGRPQRPGQLRRAVPLRAGRVVARRDLREADGQDRWWSPSRWPGSRGCG